MSFSRISQAEMFLRLVEDVIFPEFGHIEDVQALRGPIQALKRAPVGSDAFLECYERANRVYMDLARRHIIPYNVETETPFLADEEYIPQRRRYTA